MISEESHHSSPSQPGEGNFNLGKWSQEQHSIFLLALEKYQSDWKKIATEVRTRSSSQVRSHAQKYFNKIQNDQEKIGKNKTFIIGCQNASTNTRSRLKEIQLKEIDIINKNMQKMDKQIQRQKKGKKKQEYEEMDIEECNIEIPFFTRYRPRYEMDERDSIGHVETSVDQSYFTESIVPKFNERGFNLKRISKLNLYDFIDGRCGKEK